ncbi:DNA-processing protein DprA [Methanoregula formicica]|nr:DNA-processing protein DprA [Methanoregula formicica]
MEYVKYFQDSVFLHELFDNTFVNYVHCVYRYPDIGPIIEKSENIRKKRLIDFYVDAINGYTREDVRIISINDNAYPKKLINISDPPFIIYQKGDPSCLTKPAIGVVGSRTISPKGIENVREIVKTCVDLGFVIVSGLALGTDTYAHQTALECGGKTIAILPGDIDNIVPTENRDLANKIVFSGALISEITNLTKMHKGRYIERNRITSALSNAVIVIESDEHGGSIRQAETAFKHGKTVFIVRADKSDERAFRGYKKLLSLGAISLDSPLDLPQHLEAIRKPESKIATLADFS